jgi:hypothetical protein
LQQGRLKTKTADELFAPDLAAMSQRVKICQRRLPELYSSEKLQSFISLRDIAKHSWTGTARVTDQYGNNLRRV